VYAHSDLICLSLDEKNTSWAGKKFDMNQEKFSEFIFSIDKEKKITVLRENFHNPSLSPMQNEVAQRNRMAEFMGKVGWHIQLDCDEYFIDFEGFVRLLKSKKITRQSTNICCLWTTLFKKVNEGFLIIEPINQSGIETIPIATQTPIYLYGRRNGNFNIQTNFRLLHQSWARKEEEILQKISNWGHKNDFDSEKFVNFWRSLNSQNYKRAHNFHPIDPKQWHRLRLIECSSIETLTNELKSLEFVNYSWFDLVFKNSRMFSKVRSIIK
jgi:hypothetical protein